MGEPWSNIAALLRQQKLLAPQSLRERLLALEHPQNVIEAAGPLAFGSGILTADMLDAMMAHAANGTAAPVKPKPAASKTATDLARTVAPLQQPEPIDLMLRNNLPDWSGDDFSMHASDAASDITVHCKAFANLSFRTQTSQGSIRKSPACLRKVPAIRATKTKRSPSAWSTNRGTPKTAT